MLALILRGDNAPRVYRPARANGTPGSLHLPQCHVPMFEDTRPAAEVAAEVGRRQGSLLALFEADRVPEIFYPSAQWHGADIRLLRLTGCLVKVGSRSDNSSRLSITDRGREVAAWFKAERE